MPSDVDAIIAKWANSEDSTFAAYIRGALGDFADLAADRLEGLARDADATAALLEQDEYESKANVEWARGRGQGLRGAAGLIRAFVATPEEQACNCADDPTVTPGAHECRVGPTSGRLLAATPVHAAALAGKRIAELEAALAKAPLRTFASRAADALADEVDVLVRTKVIDSRSPAADALLDYRASPSSERSRRIADVALRRGGYTEDPEGEAVDKLQAAMKGGG